MIGIFIALISGALMSVQGVFNTEVTKSSSMWAAAGWVQFSALFTCLAIWLFRERTGLLQVFSVSPKYMLLGGVFGAFITFTVVRSMGDLGPAKATMLIVIAQLLVSYLIELFGIFQVERVDFEWRKALGMAIAIVGVVIFKWE